MLACLHQSPMGHNNKDCVYVYEHWQTTSDDDGKEEDSRGSRQEDIILEGKTKQILLSGPDLK